MLFLKQLIIEPLRYVPDTAIIHSNGSINGKNVGPEHLFDDNKGAFIGYSDDYWGVLPGCNQYAGYVTFRIKAFRPDGMAVED